VKIADATYVVVDVETTGLDPATDEVVEVAAVATNALGDNLGMFASLVRPTKSIPPEISAVHGITDADVATAPDFFAVTTLLNDFLARFMGPSNLPTVVAHNAAFDRSFLGGMNLGWLCTMRLAKHIWPDAPNFRNQTLRYWLDVNPETFGIAPHRALGDVLVTAGILAEALLSPSVVGLGSVSVEELIAFAESPVLLKKMPLGKHRGPIADVPTDYMQWAIGPRGMTDMDADLRFTLETELFKRTRAA